VTPERLRMGIILFFVWILGCVFGHASRDARAHDPAECPPCPAVSVPACPEPPPPLPLPSSPEQSEALQRALDAIQAAEVGEHLPLGAEPVVPLGPGQ